MVVNLLGVKIFAEKFTVHDLVQFSHKLRFIVHQLVDVHSFLPTLAGTFLRKRLQCENIAVESTLYPLFEGFVVYQMVGKFFLLNIVHERQFLFTLRHRSLSKGQFNATVLIYAVYRRQLKIFGFVVHICFRLTTQSVLFRLFNSTGLLKHTSSFYIIFPNNSIDFLL
jgi:hypothetical protein